MLLTNNKDLLNEKFCFTINVDAGPPLCMIGKEGRKEGRVFSLHWNTKHSTD